jgi:hypothetical protein
MKELAQLLITMREASVIQNCAVFGAVAQMRYTEPIATLDADVLVAVPAPDRLDVPSAINELCAERGCRAEGEAVPVGAWPAHFVPAFSPLTREAMEQAETVDSEGVPLRVVRADHLAVIGLSVGRSKDRTRILSLLESGAVTRSQIADLAARHGLSGAWRRFEGRFSDDR